MGLNEKANGKFGGMIKITNTKTVPGDSAKKSNYDKEYHYASSAGTKSPMSGGNGPSGQHATTEGIKYFKASEC